MVMVLGMLAGAAFLGLVFWTALGLSREGCELDL
tara:strand:+ start:200 stop:301 length:102 start_codon:yes stop_codon:yes gene_type:complete